MNSKQSKANVLDNSDAYSERQMAYLRRNFSPGETIRQSSFVDDPLHNANIGLRAKIYNSNIFEGKVPIRVKTQSQNEIDSVLNIKIYEETANGIGYLMFRLTDERNLQFMKILQLTESKFITIKKEQKLQMGFTQFAEKFIDLVNRCKSTEASYKAVFECVLDLGHEEPAFFKIIEKNEFKELDHLILEFNQPSDQVIKAYLSDCLARSKMIENELIDRVGFLEEEIESVKNLAHIKQQKIEELVLEFNQNEKDLRSKHENQIKELQDAHETVVMDNKEKFSLLEAKLTSKYTDREKSLQHQLESLEVKFNDQKDHIAALTESNRQITSQRDILQDQVVRMELRANHLQSDLQIALDKVLMLERDNIQLRNQIIIHERALNEKDEISRQIQDKLQLYKDSLSKSEMVIDELKASVAKYEKKVTESVNEINISNELLEKYSTAVDKAKKKQLSLKHKLSNQESMINNKNNEIQNHIKDKERLHINLEEKDKLLNHKNDEIAELKARFTELEALNKEHKDLLDYHSRRQAETDNSKKIYKYTSPNISEPISSRISNTTQRLLNEGLDSVNLAKTYKFKTDVDFDGSKTDSIYKTKYGDTFGNGTLQSRYESKHDSISKDFARFDIKNINSTYEGDTTQFDTKQLKQMSNNEKKDDVDFPVPKPIQRVQFNAHNKKNQG